MFSLYEGSDCSTNLYKVLQSYREAFRKLQSDQFLMCGRKVRIFLAGDYHFLDDCLGHQGSSSTYPCGKELVDSSYLRNHSGKSHTPENYQIELRTMQSIKNNFNENLAQGGTKIDMRKTGKEHESVVRRSVLPLKSLDSVVPPVLHLTLGIVLKLYKVLVSELHGLDEKETKTTRTKDQKAIGKLWKAASTVPSNF